jgi:hypothetical protein
MNAVTAPRRLALRGTLADGSRIAIDVAQPAGAARAKGTLRVIDAHGAAVFSAGELGVLQTAPRWASVTGTTRATRSAEPRAFTATVERADPFVAGGPRTITVERQGQPALSGVLK